MKGIRALGICGSLRRESLNLKALEIGERILKEQGVEVERADLNELNLPFYSEDIESEGFPPGAERIIGMASRADLFLFASPEYNGSVSGPLKNAIDWLSRSGVNCLRGKVAAIFGVSSGSFGTLRGQLHLRDILIMLDVFVLPQPQVCIKFGREAFRADGSFSDPKTEELLAELLRKSLVFAGRNKNE